MNLRVANLYGGVPKRDQFYAARKSHIIVATPGRLSDYLTTSTRNQLKNVQTLILDEADRMLELNFQKELDEVVQRVPETRQTCLFSATWDK